MSDISKAAVVAGVAAGYLLGRSGKAKLALVVAAYAASKKLQAKPQQLLAAGAGKLGESLPLSQLSDQVRSEVLTVGREALKAAVDQRLGSFADSLADRTKSLSGSPGGEEEPAEEEAADEEEGEEEQDARAEPEGEEEEEEEGPEGESEERAPEQKKKPPKEPAKPKKPAPAKKAAKSASRTNSQKTAKKKPAEQSRRGR